MINPKYISELILIIESCSPIELGSLLNYLLTSTSQDLSKVPLNAEARNKLDAYFKGKNSTDVWNSLLCVAMTAERKSLLKLAPVYTFGERYGCDMPSIRDSLLELISNAKKSIYLFGFWLTEGAFEIIKALSVAADRGVNIIIIADSFDNFITPLTNSWSGNRQPSIYVLNKQISRIDDLKMHAKTVIVDEARYLLSSANLTFLGLEHNLELGLVVSDRLSAEKYCHFLSHLIHDSKYFSKHQ